jgi:hypothetical protein
VAAEAEEVVVSKEVAVVEGNGGDDVVKSEIWVPVLVVLRTFVAGKEVRWTRERYGGICLLRL